MSNSGRGRKRPGAKTIENCSAKLKTLGNVPSLFDSAATDPQNFAPSGQGSHARLRYSDKNRPVFIRLSDSLTQELRNLPSDCAMLRAMSPSQCAALMIVASGAAHAVVNAILKAGNDKMS